MATKLVNAQAHQRVLAKVLDTVVPALAVIVVFLLGGGPAIVLTAAGLTLLYWIGVLVWEAVSGRTPGNVAVGLVTVSAVGGPPGFGAVLVRALALSVASIVPVIGPFLLLVSNLWDRDGQRRGWHDKLVGTYVLDVRAGRDPLRTGGLYGDGAQPTSEDEAASLAPAGDRSQDLALAGGRGPAVSPVGTAGHRVASPAPAAVAAPTPPPITGPTAGGLPSGDGPAAPSPVEADESPVPAQRVLVFDDGTEVEFAGQALIGRNPEPRRSEAVDYLINFADLNRSVDRTHVRVGLAQGSVWVTDRSSTNGSYIVDQTGLEQPLHPEVPMLLPAGCSIRFGDRRFTVR